MQANMTVVSKYVGAILDAEPGNLKVHSLNICFATDLQVVYRLSRNPYYSSFKLMLVEDTESCGIALNFIIGILQMSGVTYGT